MKTLHFLVLLPMIYASLQASNGQNIIRTFHPDPSSNFVIVKMFQQNQDGTVSPITKQFNASGRPCLMVSSTRCASPQEISPEGRSPLSPQQVVAAVRPSTPTNQILESGLETTPRQLFPTQPNSTKTTPGKVAFQTPPHYPGIVSHRHGFDDGDGFSDLSSMSEESEWIYNNLPVDQRIFFQQQHNGATRHHSVQNRNERVNQWLTHQRQFWLEQANLYRRNQ